MVEHVYARQYLDEDAVSDAGIPLTDRMAFGLNLVASILIVLFAGAANAYFLAGWYTGMGQVLGVEHGDIEDTQLLVLGAAFGLFFFSCTKGTGAVKVGATALAMLVAAGFVRELDVKTLGGPDWFRWLARHGLQETLFALMALPIPIYLLAKRRYFRDLLRLSLRREALFLYFAAIVIIVGSVILDRHLPGREEVHFWEEFIEYNGYLLFAAAAWFHAWLIGDARYSQSLD
jgi:hypothetical protein